MIRKDTKSYPINIVKEFVLLPYKPGWEWHRSFETLEKHYLNNEEPATPYLDKFFAVPA